MGGRHSTAAATGRWLAALRAGGKVVAAVLSLLLIVGFWYGWRNYRDLDNGLHKLAIADLGTHRPASDVSAHPDIDGKDQNILIVGNDDRSDMTDQEVKDLHTGRDGGSINTDTMMIVHVPADGSKATLISLPRDSYVDIPGFRKNKLNAAYPDGYYYNAPDGASDDARRAAGASQLVKTIHELTGLQIDHFLQVDLIGFYRISLAIGPVTVNLCARTDDPNSGLHLPAGVNHIVGRTALAFVRQRETLRGGDLAREQRQRYFLTAAFRKIESLDTLINPGRLHSLIQAVDRSIYVDDTFSITSLADQMINLSADNIVGKTIPVEDEEMVDGIGDSLIVDPAKVQAFVHNLIAGSSGAASTTPAAPSTSASSSPAPSSPGKAPIDAGCIH